MPLNISEIRKNFPLLKSANPPVYFDSACQSLRPEKVINAIKEYYEEYPACGERSLHRLGDKVTKKVDEARLEIARFIGVKENEIIFTKNTTESINLIAHSLPFEDGDSVLISDKEHNSNFLPWIILEKEKKIKLIILETENGLINLNLLADTLKKNKIKLVSLALTSNLDGETIEIKAISKIVKENGALLLLDAAQSMLHRKINAKELKVDFLAFSGHKMLGPSGTGVLYVNNLPENHYQLSPFIVDGGTILDLDGKKPIFLEGPEQFEAGLQNYAGIIGLGEAVKFLKSLGLENIETYENKLSKIFYQKLAEDKDLTVINPTIPNESRSLVSFFIKNKDSHRLCLLLDEGFNIAARSGFFCDHFYFHKKNIPGALRFSFAFYNTEEEINFTVDSLKKIKEIL